MSKNKAYIDGKCSPWCNGGHPIAPNTFPRRVVRFFDRARRGWLGARVSS